MSGVGQYEDRAYAYLHHHTTRYVWRQRLRSLCQPHGLSGFAEQASITRLPSYNEDWLEFSISRWKRNQACSLQRELMLHAWCIRHHQ